ncbi:MAG: aminotransferase class I/II-fold pyridoxal phosphate-dependent enzyme [Bacteroidia bacterium]|nr:aminotransferase class I/II-fold pyridoxal phosphate-dependent enzyme [Bacteroidia bacterium]
MASDLGKYADIGHGYFSFPKLTGEIGPRMLFNGKPILNWSLNNYLGLANHPEVRKIDAEAAATFGLAYPMGSRMLTGNTDYHEQFERMAAAYVNKEDAYLLNFGYQGCVSIIQALTDRKDVIIYDQLSHACIIDGMSLSLAKRFVFAHNDMVQLEDRLQKAQRIVEKTGGGILVITEGVFGMKGDTGRLDLICELKKKYTFRLFVDDAHGFGIMGKTGSGTPEYYGVSDQVDVLFCTFAKSMALIGAFVAADKQVIKFLRYHMRSQIYAKSLPLAITIGAIKRLELILQHPEYKDRCWAIATAIQSGLRERGFDLGITNTPVTPVYMNGGEGEAAQVVVDLRENYNIFVSVVTYPVIERGKFILRIIPTAAHTMEDVQETLEAFSAVRNKLLNGKYAAFPLPV